MKRCSKCVLPATYNGGLKFDEDGVCEVCNNVAKKKDIDWDKKLTELGKIAVKTGQQYDCIVPFSGGKDSTFTLWYVVKKLGLKPLVVRFNHLFFRPEAEENNERTFRILGVDVIDYKPNPETVKKIMFHSLKTRQDPCLHCHRGVFVYPMQIAVKFGIKLVIWGESNAEYQANYEYGADEEVDEARFNKIVNMGSTIEELQKVVDDIEPFRYPTKDELKGIRSICLGSYMPWNPRKNAELIKSKLGWKGAEVEGVPEEYWWEKMECHITAARDWLIYLKSNMSRAAHLYSIDLRDEEIIKTDDIPDGFLSAELRNGKRSISRFDSLYFLKTIEGKEPEKSLKYLLDFLGISKGQFYRLIEGKEI